jgi:hypothetical protein
LIRLGLIRQYTPYCPKHECKKNVSLRRNAPTTAEELMILLSRATVSASGRL